jgi:C4-dicarboxylate-binding protein DctP
MKFDRILAAGVAALILPLGALNSAPAAAQTIEMKIGYATINEPQDVLAKKIVEEMGKRTNGRVAGRIFPASQLGGIQRMIEGTQLGTQEVYIGPPGFMNGINPAFSAFDAPGLFDDAEHAHRAITHPEFRDKYARLVEDKGILCTSLWIYDTTWIAASSPIRRLDDIRGKKFRVLATKMESELMSVLGGTGVPMDYTELMAALQNKTLDGVRTSIVVLNGSKAYNVAKYITFEGSGMIPSCVATSKLWLDKLPADVRKSYLDLGRELDDWASAMARDFAKGAEKVWTDNGGEIFRMPDADYKALMTKLKPLGDQFLDTNPRVKPTYDLLKQVVEKTRKKA